MTKQELIERIKQNTIADKDITFRLRADNEKPEKLTITAEVYGITFTLWEHQASVEQFYMTSSEGINRMQNMAAAGERLAAFLGVDTGKGMKNVKASTPALPDEVLEKLRSMSDEIQQATKDGHINEGKVLAYEHILSGVQITIQK